MLQILICNIILNNMDMIENLEKERQALYRQLIDVQTEIKVINKLILRKKAEVAAKNGGEVINRKNIGRISNEAIILDCLRASKNGLRTTEISQEIKSLGYELPDNTIRSYIARMRDKGLIHKKNNSYRWLAKP